MAGREIALGDEARVVEPELIVCPQWDSQMERFRGGERHGVTPLPCSRCGCNVAVPLNIWKSWRYEKRRFRFLCLPCSMILESQSG